MPPASAEALTARTVYFEPGLIKRAKRLKKRKTFSAMCRDGVRDQVLLFESQIDEDENQRERVKEHDRTERRLRELGESSALSPDRATAPMITPTPAPGVNVNAHLKGVSALYEKHAQSIATAFANPVERRLRALEAVRNIMQASPLTHPGEQSICEALEVMVLEIRQRTQLAQPVTSAPSVLFNNDEPPKRDHAGRLNNFFKRVRGIDDQQAKRTDDADAE